MTSSMTSFTKIVLLALVCAGFVMSDVSLTGTAPEDDVSFVQIGAEVRGRLRQSASELTDAEKLISKLTRENEALKAAYKDLEQENYQLKDALSTCQRMRDNDNCSTSTTPAPFPAPAPPQDSSLLPFTVDPN